MSAAAGAPQPPNQPMSGPSKDSAPDGNGNDDSDPIAPTNKWTKDEKTKTCKCEACGNRVRFWSYKCERCGRHICSECLERRSENSIWGPVVAHDHVTDKCWCHYRSNMNPKFANWKPPPPVRTEEEQKARESKGLATFKKAAKADGQSKRKASSLDETEEAYSPDSAGDVASQDPDEDYMEPQSTFDIDATAKAKRTAIKRKAYLKDESEGEVAHDRRCIKTKPAMDGVQPKRSKRTVDLTHMESAENKATASNDETLEHSAIAPLIGTSTVIVGAGIVGLFVARELAIETRKANIVHHVTVVDIRGEECELASKNCNGFLTTSGMPDRWSPAANLAQRFWREISSTGEFHEKLEFTTNTLFEVSNSGGGNHERGPSWLRRNPELSLLEDSNYVGRIDPRALGTWLMQECERLQVNFHFNHYVADIFTADSGLSNVRLQTVASPEAPTITIKCRNLIVAAGPFTTGIFNDLFKGHSVKLMNHVQSTHWYHAGLKRGLDGDGVGLRIQQAAEAEARLENEIRVLSRNGNSALEISAMAKGAVDKILDRNAALNPRKAKTTELRSIAAKYVDQNSLEVDDNGRTAILAKGRSEISIANGGCPIIDRVSVSDLGMVNNDGTKRHGPCDVWLCYGFGRYGTMLAPGAARMLVTKMFGKSPEHDDYAFSLPYSINQDTKGKGKGRAS